VLSLDFLVVLVGGGVAAGVEGAACELGRGDGPGNLDRRRRVAAGVASIGIGIAQRVCWWWPPK
jgi:hypothetical protein